MLGGAVRAQVAIEIEWKACVETAKAKAAEFKALFTAKEA